MDFLYALNDEWILFFITTAAAIYVDVAAIMQQQ